MAKDPNSYSPIYTDFASGTLRPYGNRHQLITYGVPPSKFRIFIPPGTIEVTYIVFCTQDARVGIMTRLGQPPICTYYGSGYTSLPWEFNTSLSQIRYDDGKARNYGGTIQVVSGTATGVVYSGGEWIYGEIISYGGYYLAKARFTWWLDITEYNAWLNSGADKEPIKTRTNTSGTCSPFGSGGGGIPVDENPPEPEIDEPSFDDKLRFFVPPGTYGLTFNIINESGANVGVVTRMGRHPTTNVSDASTLPVSNGWSISELRSSDRGQRNSNGAMIVVNSPSSVGGSGPNGVLTAEEAGWIYFKYIGDASNIKSINIKLYWDSDYYNSIMGGADYYGDIETVKGTSDTINRRLKTFEGGYRECWYFLVYDYRYVEPDFQIGDGYQRTGTFLTQRLMRVDNSYNEVFGWDFDGATEVWSRYKIMEWNSTHNAVWGDSYSSYADNNYILTFDYDDTIYFWFGRQHGSFTATPDECWEFWRYKTPTVHNTKGEIVNMQRADTGWHSYDPGGGAITGVNTNFSNSKYLVSNWDERTISNYVENSPVQCVHELLMYDEDLRPPKTWYPGGTSYDYWDDAVGEGWGYRLNIIDYNSYADAKNTCLELVPDTVYFNAKEIEINEPRYLFSKTIDKKIKIYDLISEMLQTACGYMVYCHGKLKFIIPHANETAVHYFGFHIETFVSNQNSGLYKRIYADFSLYENNYWSGDLVTFEINGKKYNDCYVISQTDTYIELDDYLDVFFPEGNSFTIKKDNMKRGSFVYSKKSMAEKPNRISIEYKNRLMGYMTDIVVADDDYRIQEEGYIKPKHFEMHGIKRATQAGRVAQRLIDYESFVNWTCAFESDVLGLGCCVGDIVGITHPITNWEAKLFRIISINELTDHEAKIECEEYLPGVYHDKGIPIYQGSGGGGGSDASTGNVGNVERFTVHEDSQTQNLYFGFKPPKIDDGTFAGVQLYRLEDDGSWTYIGDSLMPSDTIKLSQDIDEDDTTIYFDIYSGYGEFPNKDGVFWIGNEQIYYTNVDQENYAFTGVTRGYNDSEATSHSEGDLIVLRKEDLFKWEYSESDIGKSITFKAVAFSSTGSTASFSTAPTYTITISGYGYLPYPPALLRISEV